MREHEFEVDTVEVAAFCGGSCAGEMKPTGIASGSGRYQHQCRVCGRLENYPVVYPMVRHRRVEL